MSHVRAALALAVLLTMLVSSGCGRKAMPEPRKSERFVAHFINTAAFERRCIRSSGVVPHMPVKEHGIGWRGYPRESVSSGSGALLAVVGDTPFIFDEETRNVPRHLSRAPCRRGASTLSVLRRIYEKDHR